MSDTKMNDDGLEAGKSVTFEQIQQAEAKRRMIATKANDQKPKIPENPEDIDELKKADLVELLKAHGDDKPEGKVSELKAQLKAVMFSGL